MHTFAAVMTGKGTGAISTVQLFGKKSETILKKIFEHAGTKPAKFKTGEIILGTIVDGSETIDQVTIGCEGPNNFAINCHGNPLVVEMIMRLLAKQGATLLTAEQLLCKILASQGPINTITLEAKLTQPKAKTLQGTKVIANQIDAGLGKKAADWLKNINEMSLDQIKNYADTILKNSPTAKLIIFGCRIVIVGPSNTGKSTLLNCLAGREKAVVTHIPGTTRDWVSAGCRIEPLSVELIDTAGLNEKPLTNEDAIEKAAQKKSVEILENADLVLLVLDNSKSSDQLDNWLLGRIADKKILTVLNKSDLPAKFDTGKLPQSLANIVKISAKFGTAIAVLTEKIRQLTGSADFNLKTAVCFTDRQENLLKQLKKAKSMDQAASLITELLNGKLRV